MQGLKLRLGSHSCVKIRVRVRVRVRVMVRVIVRVGARVGIRASVKVQVRVRVRVRGRISKYLRIPWWLRASPRHRGRPFWPGAG